MAAPRSPFVIGIDLGTTFSCVGVWKNNRVEIIPNKTGRRTTPSVVAFTEERCLVGEAAKNHVVTNSENTLFDAKRLIGRRFNDSAVQEDMKHWPFKVVDRNNVPHMQVMHRGETKTFAPEEVSAMILRKLKEDAENYLGHPVRDAVITCPAYFNDDQRAATKNAGHLAGLNVIRVINEPTAAAIAYGLDRREGRSNVLVFDFGGGTLDVSLMTIDGRDFLVKAVAGDTHLGGEDLTSRLVEYCADEFHRMYDRDLTADTQSSNPEIRKKAKIALARLRSSCEEAKCFLSASPSADVSFSYGGAVYESTISQALFDNLCMDIFRRCTDPIGRVLRDAEMDRGDISDIVLVGGSTRIPRVQKMVSEFFGNRELCHTVNPDEAVAYGAAFHAFSLRPIPIPEPVPTPAPGPRPRRVNVIEVTSLSLGMDIVGDRMAVVVPHNTAFPCKKSKMFTTTADNQTEADFRVFEGENPHTTGDHLLGNFLLHDIPPAPAGVPQFEVIFDIDSNGILNVSAQDINTGNMNRITITNQGRLTQEQIDRLIRDGNI